MKARPQDHSRPSASLFWLAETTGRDLLAAGTDAFRMAEGPGLSLERYGQAALLSHTSLQIPEGLVATALEHPLATGIHAVYHKLRVSAPGKSDRPSLLHGKPNSPRFIASELGLRFAVDFSAGYSCGLFLDQRANRALVRSFAPRHLLNCFAFTGSFSVAAAASGSLSTNIDLAKGILHRARENFALNDLPLEGHRFYAEDVFQMLPRLARRGEKFDVIILDPPTFSRGQAGRIFRAAEHLDSLLALALACAAPEARILLSTNCSTLHLADLHRIVRTTCPGAQTLEPGPQQPDITDGATTLWFRVPAT